LFNMKERGPLTRPCPECTEVIPLHATTCPRCRAIVAGAAAQPAAYSPIGNILPLSWRAFAALVFLIAVLGAVYRTGQVSSSTGRASERLAMPPVDRPAVTAARSHEPLPHVDGLKAP